MKIIVFYSGKGGVGKTTTTANIAHILAEKGSKILILDADINTPSMQILFPKDKVKNIDIISMGYETAKSIYLSGSFIRKYFNEAKKVIKRNNYDFILIDTPPSLTDIHLNLFKTFDVSGIVYITQETILSKVDLSRTALYFSGLNINTIGLVKNMVLSKENKIDYGMEVLAEIEFVKNFNSKEIYITQKKQYLKIAKVLYNTKEIILKNIKKQFLNSDLTVEDVKDMKPTPKKFINVATWEFIKEYHLKMLSSEDTVLPIHNTDKFLDLETADRIERMLKEFEYDTEAYFMVTKPPNTEIFLLPTEIGKCTLVTDKKSYYGVPRVSYQTDQGPVILFAHEIKPINNKELLLLLEDNTYNLYTDGRYIPKINIIKMIENSFGNRLTGLPSDWEELYLKNYSEMATIE